MRFLLDTNICIYIINIGSLDTLIAAHALSLEVILVTNNEKEFKRVPNLKLDNWVS